jgi:hypothetical protein
MIIMMCWLVLVVHKDSDVVKLALDIILFVISSIKT